MSDKSTRKKIIEVARELATPINFDELIAKGILIHRSAQWYEVIDFDALPSYARRQVCAIKQERNEKVLLRFSLGWKQAQQFYRKLTGKNYNED